MPLCLPYNECREFGCILSVASDETANCRLDRLLLVADELFPVNYH